MPVKESCKDIVYLFITMLLSLTAQHLLTILRTNSVGEQQNQYLSLSSHQAVPCPPKNSLLFAFFFFLFVHHALSSTPLNGMGHETKLRNATGPRGTATECSALLLIMVLIKRLLDAAGLGKSVEESFFFFLKKERKEKKEKKKRQMEERTEQD